jgi:hypothetical protein
MMREARATTSGSTAGGRMREKGETIAARWGDKFLSVRGALPIVVVVLGAALMFAGWLLVKQTEAPVQAIKSVGSEISSQHGELRNMLSDQRAATAREHEALVKTQERIADSLDEQVFFLSKTEKERARYTIEMPESLQRKLIQRGK